MSARNDRQLWLWVVAAFALLFGAWTVMFTVASRHRIPEVRLEKR